MSPFVPAQHILDSPSPVYYERTALSVEKSNHKKLMNIQEKYAIL